MEGRWGGVCAIQSGDAIPSLAGTRRGTLREVREGERLWEGGIPVPFASEGP